MMEITGDVLKNRRNVEFVDELLTLNYPDVMIRTIERRRCGKRIIRDAFLYFFYIISE